MLFTRARWPNNGKLIPVDELPLETYRQRLGAAIRFHRLRKHLTLAVLTLLINDLMEQDAAMHERLSANAVSLWERGKTAPTVDKFPFMPRPWAST